MKYEQNQKALRMALEDSTLEEATWALGQVTGLCHLSLRPRQDGESHSVDCTLLYMMQAAPVQRSRWFLLLLSSSVLS